MRKPEHSPQHGPGAAGQLAIDGGVPLRDRPFPSWPVFGPEEIEAVARVLGSGKVNYWNGDQVRLFEEEFARAVGCRHAVAVANGTVALELALHALGIEAGDEVVVTPRSFVASATCAAIRGAVPVFADVDPHSGNLTVDSIGEVLTPRTRAIVAVHLAGWPCEMDPILRLADRHGLVVIEDCAQAHGATYRGRPVGSMGHAAAFSFCQDKILTTGGEGGMLVTRDRALWQRAWSYKDHGKDYDAAFGPNPSGVFQWLHRSIGTNLRMTEMQAAIGRVVLGRLSQWSETRRRLAGTLAERLSGLPALRVPQPPGHVDHACYKFYAFLRPELLPPGWTRDRVVAAIRAEGIPCGSGACGEIYREAALEGVGWRRHERLPVARELAETSLMFQCHPTLTPEDMEDTARAVEKVLARASAQPHERAA